MEKDRLVIRIRGRKYLVMRPQHLLEKESLPISLLYVPAESVISSRSCVIDISLNWSCSISCEPSADLTRQLYLMSVVPDPS